MKQFALFTLVFAAGFGVCWLVFVQGQTRHASPPLSAGEWNQDVYLWRVGPGGHPEYRAFRVYAASAGGSSQQFDKPPEEQTARWTIKFAKSNINLTCVEIPPP